MNIGAAIKKLRTDAGMYQSDIAKLAGVTQSYISHLENGNHLAGPETIKALAWALKIPVAVIYVTAITPEDITRKDKENKVVIEKLELGKKLLLQAL